MAYQRNTGNLLGEKKDHREKSIDAKPSPMTTPSYLRQVSLYNTQKTQQCSKKSEEPAGLSFEEDIDKKQESNGRSITSFSNFNKTDTQQQFLSAL